MHKKIKIIFKEFAISCSDCFFHWLYGYEIIKSIKSALDIISHFLFCYHFIHSHFSLSEQAPISITYSQE